MRRRSMRDSLSPVPGVKYEERGMDSTIMAGRSGQRKPGRQAAH